MVRSIGLSRSVSGRVAEFLLASATDGQVTNGVVRARLAMTHEEIAQITGTNRESITRIMSEFSAHSSCTLWREEEPMTPTPDTKAGRITEEIMAVFRAKQPSIVKLDTSQYNAIYSHVLDTLNRNLGCDAGTESDPDYKVRLQKQFRPTLPRQ